MKINSAGYSYAFLTAVQMVVSYRWYAFWPCLKNSKVICDMGNSALAATLGLIYHLAIATLASRHTLANNEPCDQGAKFESFGEKYSVLPHFGGRCSALMVRCETCLQRYVFLQSCLHLSSQGCLARKSSVNSTCINNKNAASRLPRCLVFGSITTIHTILTILRCS